MKVSILQQFVRSLATPLRQAGVAAKVTDDVEQTCQNLEPFADLDVWQLAELLRQAKEYRDTGILPVSTKKPTAPRKPAQPKHDPAVVMEFAQKLRALEEKAATYESTRDELREGLDELNLDKLSKDNLVAIARELSRAVKGNLKKDDVIDMLRRVVLERKEVLEGALT